MSAIVLLRRSAKEYLAFGVDGKSARRDRMRYALNAFSALTGASALGFSLAFVVYDFWGLWPASLAISLCLYQFANPYLVARNETVGNIAGSANACVTFMILTWLLGRDAGLYVFIVQAPLVVLLFVGPSRPLLVAGIFAMSLAAISTSVVLFDQPASFVTVDPSLLATLRVSTLAFSMVFITGTGFLLLRRMEQTEDALEAEHELSEALLANLLPLDIAARLKSEPGQTIADSLPKAAILFADVVNFTPLAARKDPESVVEILSRIFSAFDSLSEKHGLEKIKTIGDAYMAAAGIPKPCSRPAHRAAAMALDMLVEVDNLSEELGETVAVRIGINSGPVVAGVIGNRKPFYDVWGETVNTASRMESHGLAGKIQVSDSTRRELDDTYEFTSRGTVEIKGIGPVQTWWLTGQKAVNTL